MQSLSKYDQTFDTSIRIGLTVFFCTLRKPVGEEANLVIANPAYSRNTDTLYIARISPIAAR